MKKRWIVLISVFLFASSTWAAGSVSRKYSAIYNPGRLQPVDSKLKVAPGDEAPDFTLPAVSGTSVTLSSFRGKSNVVLSFVPAAWTPVCSGQWPGDNLAQQEFVKNDAVLLGISVDNIPTLYAWIEEMNGLWFEVLSDFYPHGAVAQEYGILRSDGTAERALFFIDKQGIITAVHVEDINVRPSLEYIFKELKNFSR